MTPRNRWRRSLLRCWHRVLLAGRTAKPINLALQGGGSHGAFTWGVLDRLLEDGRLTAQAVSGASAGAMNAVALAAGLMEGGPDRAREKLAAFWRAVSEAAIYSPLQRPAFGLGSNSASRLVQANHVFLDMMTRLISPYQLNPLDFNPLRDLLNKQFDFPRLRRESPVGLYIAATDIANGKARVFNVEELSVDALLASACLPHLHKAVKIEQRHYWDGGYSSNPPILPLLRHERAKDTLLIQLDPIRDSDLPTNSQAIIARINRLTFNGPLRREIEMIEQVRAMAIEGFSIGGTLRRKILDHRFHHIEAEGPVRELDPHTKLHPDWGLLCDLRDMGRATADTWLRQSVADVGRRPTVDLPGKFL